MKKLVLATLTATLCLSTPSAFAQKKGLIKGALDALSSKTPALSARIQRQVARASLRAQTKKIAHATRGAQLEQQLARQITDYHPVFGYTLPKKPVLSLKLDLRTPFRSAEMDPTALIQVKPILDKRHIQTAFEMYKELDLPQTTEMAYLWRLANPSKDLAPDLHHAALTRLNDVEKTVEHKIQNLPNIRFLRMVIDPLYTPHTYAQLWENITTYPKYVGLDFYGLPVQTEYANYAKELDLYLMLSNPKEMGSYNNAGKYTPLVLTEEEHIAADELLALRMREEKIPENPIPRDLLNLTYNRLAAHTVPYTTVILSKATGRWSVDTDYQAYPNYKNTDLYRAIKNMLQDKNPYSYPAEDLNQYELDILFLFVLDAIMGGVDPNDLDAVNRVLSAFDKICMGVPLEDEAFRHIAILQNNLRFVFDDLINFNSKGTIKADEGYKALVAERAQRLLLTDIATYRFYSRHEF